MQWMQTQKFDLGLTAMYGSCQYGMFHMAGIKLVIGFVATPASHYMLNVIGIDTPSSYTNGAFLRSFWKNLFHDLKKLWAALIISPKQTIQGSKICLTSTTFIHFSASGMCICEQRKNIIAWALIKYIADWHLCICASFLKCAHLREIFKKKKKNVMKIFMSTVPSNRNRRTKLKLCRKAFCCNIIHPTAFKPLALQQLSKISKSVEKC